jgi:cytochrome c peroxidase
MEHATLLGTLLRGLGPSAAGLLLVALARGQGGTIGTFPNVAVPSGNPLTPEKALLGKALFFEEQLSSDDTMACASCHLPEAGGGDPLAGAREAGVDGVLGTLDDEFGSPGVVRQDERGDYRGHSQFGLRRQVTPRNAPSVIDAAFFNNLFWDQRAEPAFRDLAGRVVLPSAAALESQAVGPFLSPVEMAREGRTWADLVAKLGHVRPLDLASDLPPALADFVAGAEDYAQLFERAFGSPEITRERIAMAIASYERTLVSDHTPFDLGTLTAQEQAGLQVFREHACAACHSDQNRLFSDGFSAPIGLPGHSRFVKTPSLRNVALRERLMSSGQFRSLDEVLDHYVAVGFTHPFTDEERAAVIAFMAHGLTDPRAANRRAPFDRPTLHGESAASRGYGRGSPSSDGRVPELVANVPALLGGELKLGLGNAAGGSLGLLVLSRSAKATDFGGIPLLVDPASALCFPLLLSGVGPGEGVATLRLRIPADSRLLGVERFVQGFVRDPGVPGGLAATRAGRIELVSRLAVQSGG